MCQDCVNDSQHELEGHILQKFGLDVCYTCVTTVWRNKALKPRLEQAAHEAIDYARGQLEMKLYMLKQEQV